MVQQSFFEGRRSSAARRQRPVAFPPPPARPAEIQRWVERCRQLPDLRWDKVQAIRIAIATGRYDVTSRVDHLVEHAPDELVRLLGEDPSRRSSTP